MSIKGWRVLAAVTLATLGSQVVRAADSCGGGCSKAPSSTRAVSTPFPVPLPEYPAPVLTASLARRQKRTMLNVEATNCDLYLSGGRAVATGALHRSERYRARAA